VRVSLVDTRMTHGMRLTGFLGRSKINFHQDDFLGIGNQGNQINDYTTKYKYFEFDFN